MEKEDSMKSMVKVVILLVLVFYGAYVKRTAQQELDRIRLTEAQTSLSPDRFSSSH